MNSIRLAKLSDVTHIKRIIDEGISIDYYSEETIRDYINNKDDIFYIYVNEDDIPIACLLCETGTLDKTCVRENISWKDEAFSDYNKDTKVMVYKTAATDKKYRNKGILTSFLIEAGEMAKNIDHEMRFCLCLELPNGKIPVHNHVVNAGFKPVKKFISPWNNIDSYCEYCKNQYCTCNGVLYIKENSGEK